MFDLFIKKLLYPYQYGRVANFSKSESHCNTIYGNNYD
jgi:hypothetical protein